MSIFHQDIQQAVQDSSIQPGSPFWNEWLNNAIGSGRLSCGVFDISIRDGILHLSDRDINLVLTGGINLDRYLWDIKGINCGGFIKISGKDGKFEIPTDQFQLTANTIAVRGIDNFCSAAFNTVFLNIKNTGKISNSDLSGAQVIRCDEISSKFENCLFGDRNIIYYNCDCERFDEYSRICPDACTFVKDVLNDIKLIRNTRLYIEDIVKLKQGTIISHKFKHAFSYNLLNIFGVTTDIDEMIINIIQDGDIIAKIYCESYFDTRSTDPQSVTLDNFNILWTLNR